MSQQPLIAESRRQMVIHNYFELDDPTANGTQNPSWIDMISLREYTYHCRVSSVRTLVNVQIQCFGSFRNLLTTAVRVAFAVVVVQGRAYTHAHARTHDSRRAS